jgi:uncharacterized phage protein (predicted DNA packaging)
MYVALDKIKTHLNIDKDFIEDDNYLMSLSEVAECVVERHIGYKFSKLMEDNDGQLPMPIQHAMLLFIGTMYANRESVTFGSANVLPHAYDYILQLFENYDVWC